MKAGQLIEENNRKRELLNETNGKYYEDLMLYIRTQLTLSEQKSEELLMELLDHLLEGQNEGKSAVQIFGNQPKAYADQLIEQLPKEEKRSVIPFLASIVFNLFSWILMIRGLVILVVSQFRPVHIEVYPINFFIYGCMLTLFVFAGVYYIFRLIRNSLFQEKRNDKVMMFKAGAFGALATLIIFAVMKFMPGIGPAYEFSWWASLLLGLILWGLGFGLKKIEN